VAQAGGTQNIPLQQLLAAGGAQSLRLVGQPSTAPAQSQATTTATRNVVLQPLVAGNQVRLVGQQTPAQVSGFVQLHYYGVVLFVLSKKVVFFLTFFVFGCCWVFWCVFFKVWLVFDVRVANLSYFCSVNCCFCLLFFFFLVVLGT